MLILMVKLIAKVRIVNTTILTNHTQRIDCYTDQEQAMVLSEIQTTHAHSHGTVEDTGENSLHHYINLQPCNYQLSKNIFHEIIF